MLFRGLQFGVMLLNLKTVFTDTEIKQPDQEVGIKQHVAGINPPKTRSDIAKTNMQLIDDLISTSLQFGDAPEDLADDFISALSHSQNDKSVFSIPSNLQVSGEEPQFFSSIFNISNLLRLNPNFANPNFSLHYHLFVEILKKNSLSSGKNSSLPVLYLFNYYLGCLDVLRLAYGLSESKFNEIRSSCVSINMLISKISLVLVDNTTPTIAFKESLPNISAQINNLRNEFKEFSKISDAFLMISETNVSQDIFNKNSVEMENTLLNAWNLKEMLMNFDSVFFNFSAAFLEHHGNNNAETVTNFTTACCDPFYEFVKKTFYFTASKVHYHTRVNDYLECLKSGAIFKRLQLNCLKTASFGTILKDYFFTDFKYVDYINTTVREVVTKANPPTTALTIYVPPVETVIKSVEVDQISIETKESKSTPEEEESIPVTPKSSPKHSVFYWFMAGALILAVVVPAIYYMLMKNEKLKMEDLE